MKYLIFFLIGLVVFVACDDPAKLKERKSKKEKKNNEFENYKPSQPIEFSHEIHSGEAGIDCKYCHHTTDKSRNAGIPSVNLCLHCHKEDNVIPNENRLYYKKSSMEHQDFSHVEHLNLKGIDCKTCHQSNDPKSEPSVTTESCAKCHI